MYKKKKKKTRNYFVAGFVDLSFCLLTKGTKDFIFLFLLHHFVNVFHAHAHASSINGNNKNIGWKEQILLVCLNFSYKSSDGKK